MHQSVDCLYLRKQTFKKFNLFILIGGWLLHNIVVGFAKHQPGRTCVPHPEPPSHLPPHPIPQGHLSAPALSTLFHVLNLDRWSASHMIIYSFQCYPLKSSHPRRLPESPEDCSLHLCLFCCLACRVIVTIFWNSIYICISILYWCFSFWLTSLCIMGSSFIHLIRTDSNAFFLMAE